MAVEIEAHKLVLRGGRQDPFGLEFYQGNDSHPSLAIDYDGDIWTGDGSMAPVERIRRGYVDATDYVPRSDVASASAALAAAATVAFVERKRLVLPKRRYYVPSVVNLFDMPGLHIEGDGPEDSIFYHDGGDAYVFDVRGAALAETSSLLTVDAAAGDLTLTMASTEGLTAGQWINIYSDEIWDATSGKDAKYGELARVKKVDSATQVTLYAPLDYSYTVANAGQVKSCPLGADVSIRGVGFENTNPLSGTGGAAVFRQVERLVVEDVLGVGLDGPLVSLTGCVDASLLRVSGRDMADDEGNGRYGYVVNLGAGTRGAVVAQGHGYNVRNYFSFNATSSSVIHGVPAHNEVIGSTATACTSSGFSSHEEGDDISYVGCKVYNTQDMGFHLRARRSKMVGCSVDGALGTALLVRASAPDCHISGFYASKLTGSASARNNQTNAVIIQGDDTTIDGFRIENVARSGVVVAADRATIRNGFIKGYGQVSDPQAIRFSATPTADHEISDVRVDGGEVLLARALTAGAPGVVTGLRVSNLRARGVGSTPVTNITGLDSVKVLDAEVEEWVTNSTAPESKLAVSASDSVTLDLVHAGRVLEVNSTDPVTVTIPPDATTDFPVGTVIEIFQRNSGQITVAAGSGVTLRNPFGTAKARAAFSTVRVRKRLANDWVLSGDVAAS